MAATPIATVLEAQSKTLLAIPGVVGTALGLADDRPCITVYVVKRTAALDRLLPRTLGGYPVIPEETGEIHPL